MQVLKFGGSSVAGSGVIKQVMSIVQQALQKDTTIVVVSALSGVTDTLIYCGKQAADGNEQYMELLQSLEQRHLDTVRELLPVTGQSSVLSLVKTLCNELEDVCKGVFTLRELSPRTLDKITSYGELLSSQIIAAAFQSTGQLTQWADSRKLIATDSNFTGATVHFEKTNSQITDFVALHPNSLILAPGFIAADSSGATTTLGRGGSDYTAAVFAAAVQATTLEIWTDVSGMMTADPRLVANHRPIPSISYQEAMELSHFGAKVIYPPTIQPVMKLGIPVWVKNTFAPADAGTVIENTSAPDGDSITGISSIGGIALLSLEGSGMVGIPGFQNAFSRRWQ